MEHYFELPVAYDGAEHRFRARLRTFGYSYTFYVIVDGKEWTFEKEEAHMMQLTSPATEITAPANDWAGSWKNWNVRSLIRVGLKYSANQTSLSDWPAICIGIFLNN
jgi:hypothetical protein